MAEIDGWRELGAVGSLSFTLFTVVSAAVIVGFFVRPVPDRDQPCQLPLRGTRWGPLEAIFFLILYLLLQGVLAAVAGSVQLSAVKRVAEGTALDRWIDAGLLIPKLDTFVASLFLPGAGVLLVIAVCFYVSSWPPHTLACVGVQRFPGFRWQFHVFCLSLAMIVPIGVIGWLWTEAVSALGFSEDPQKVVREFANAIETGDVPMIVLGAFNASILAPIVEEALFRGLLYAALRKYFGVLPAMALTSLLFAGVHVNIISLVPIGLLSAVLCGVYEKRGSLWDPIIVHALFNTTSLVLLSSSEIFRPP